MNKQEKFQYWLNIANYDMVTAKAMLKSGRYLYVAFMCHQALEKAVKACYVLRKNDEEPPRSHNLSYLVSLLNITPAEQQLLILDRLTAFYIQGRYPTYKQKLSRLIKKPEATILLKRTKEIYKWLRSQVR